MRRRRRASLRRAVRATRGGRSRCATPERRRWAISRRGRATPGTEPPLSSRLERGGADVAAGHTATDQVETILYRLASSPSRRALLGMRAARGRADPPAAAVHARATPRRTAGPGPAVARRRDQRLRRSTRAGAYAAGWCRRCARSTRAPSATCWRSPRSSATRRRCSTRSSTTSRAASRRFHWRRCAGCRRRSGGWSSSGWPTTRPGGRRRGPRGGSTTSSRCATAGTAALDLPHGVRAVVTTEFSPSRGARPPAADGASRARRVHPMAPQALVDHPPETQIRSKNVTPEDDAIGEVLVPADDLARRVRRAGGGGFA